MSAHKDSTKDVSSDMDREEFPHLDAARPQGETRWGGEVPIHHASAQATVQARVPFHDCDPLGVVWHGRYFEYFELARTALFAQCKLDIADMQVLGHRMYVTDARCRYMYPLAYGDEVSITATVVATQPLVRISYDLRNLSKARRSARGYTVLAITDAEGKLLPKTPACIDTQLKPSSEPRAASHPPAHKDRPAILRNNVCIAGILPALVLVLVAAIAQTPIAQRSIARASPPASTRAQRGQTQTPATHAARRPEGIHPPPPTLSALLAHFARLPGLEVDFVEEKHIALLKAPITSQGTIYFLPPDTLVRDVRGADHAEGPPRERTIIAPDVIHHHANGVTQTIDLHAKREIQPLAQAVLWIFSGNEEALIKAFRHRYRVEAKRFSLTLEPQSPALRALLRSIRVEGEGRSVQTVSVEEANGDRAVTTLQHANPQRRFSKQERRKLLRPVQDAP